MTMMKQIENSRRSPLISVMPRWLAKISWAGMITLSLVTSAQASPTVLRDIAGATSAERIEADIQTLVNFGTRHTLSETVSDTRGIGAARRWIQARSRSRANLLQPCLLKVQTSNCGVYRLHWSW